MGQNTSLNWRIIGATLFSLVLVVGAFLLARGIGSPPLAEASVETALLEAIATRDSNGDGLPDWQGALYGIPLDSPTTDYFNLGMTNGEAVARGLIVPKAVADIAVATSSDQSVIVDPSLPSTSPEGTLTDTFAKNFFALYVSAKQANGGVQLSQTQIDTLAGQALGSLASMVIIAPDYKSAGDLTVSDSGADALKAFAASAEAIIQKNRNATDATKNEILYLQDVVQDGDTSALSSLVAVAKRYRDTAVGLAALPIPTELSAHTLALINQIMRSSGIASDFARVNTDPLAAMFALEQYVLVSQAANETLATIGEVYAAAGVTLPVGSPGALFLTTLNQYRIAQGTQAL